MHIAVFTKKTTLHNNFGGLETQNQALIEGLNKKGHSITVFSPRWELTKEKEVLNNINYIFVDCVYRMGPIFGFFGSLQKNNWINRSVQAFERQNKETPFDIVLAQSSTGLGIIRSKAKYNIKIVSISHGTIIGEYLTFIASMNLFSDFLKFVQNTGFTLKNFFRRQRDFVHGSDKIIAVSNYVKKALIDETFTFEDRIVVINNGIDPTWSKSPEKRGTDMLYVGQLTKSKGLDYLVAVFLDSRFKNYTLDIIGSGDYLNDLRAKISKNKLEGKINLLGRISHEEVVRDYYNNAKYGAFVFPTKRYEGFPMVLVEAMFSGLPVIGFDIGGNADAILNNQTGFLIKQGDFSEFKEGLLKLLTDRKLNEAFAKNSLDYALANLTQQRMIENYEKVLIGLVK